MRSRSLPGTSWAGADPRPHTLLHVPSRLVDTGTASFGISCCVWAAAAQRRSGALGTALVLGVPQLVARSGRAEALDIEAAAAEGSPILATIDGESTLHDTVTSVDAAVASMTGYALEHPSSRSDGRRVVIGTSDASSAPVAQGLVTALGGHPDIAELVEYRVGPSVGAFLGPGTAGLFVF